MKPSAPFRFLANSKHLASRRAQRLLALLCVLCFLCYLCVPSSQAQPDRRITFYAPQTSYSISVLDRNNTEYAGILEALEPLGSVSGRVDGKKYKLKFRDIEAQFETNKTKSKINGKSIELPAPFVLENNRGFVPISSLKTVLPAFGLTPVDVHDSARRVFIGGMSTHLVARKSDNAKVIFTFSSPVNPFIATEPGKLRMTFDREPLQSDTRLLTFDDKTIPSAAYSESNGAAELTVTANAPLTATYSDDRRTITISAVIPPVQQTTGSTAPPATPSIAPTQSGGTGSPAAAPHTRAFVIIDPAHGGTDRGSTIGDLAEKDITLALAHRLRHELETRGISAVLVRDADASLAPDQRATIANASNAALYLSLHASATGMGVRVFASPIAAQPRTALAFVQAQSLQAPVANQSRSFAAAIAQSLAAHEINANYLPAFVVPLNTIAIPAVAIEVAPSGSSPASLGTASYQQSLASAITAAIATIHTQQPREVGQ